MENLNYVNPEELEQYGNSYFSSFEGEDLYTGADDDMLDFGGKGRSFASEADAQRIFVVNITSTLNHTQKVRIFPGYTWKPGDVGVIDDAAILNDGTFFTDASGNLSASGSPKTIKEFLAFIMKNPTNLAGMRIGSTNTAQIQQQLTYRELSPFKDLQSRIIDLGAYTDENTYRDNMVTVPTPDLILSSDMNLDIPILANSTTTITFFCGGVLSQSVALKNKRERAASTINKMGIQTIRRFEKIAPKTNLRALK